MQDHALVFLFLFLVLLVAFPPAFAKLLTKVSGRNQGQKPDGTGTARANKRTLNQADAHHRLTQVRP